MARVLLQRRYWQRLRDEWQRRGPGVQSRIQAPLRANLFIDYFVDIPGTVPEKVIFNVLYQMGVNFHFARYLGDMPFTKDEYEHYRPDFILPDYGIIIEIQGDYWHSRVGSYSRDYSRALKLAALGFTVYTLYDKDVLENPWEALRTGIPPLMANIAPGEGWYTVANRPQDPRASLRALRQKWPRRNVTHPKGYRKGALSTFSLRERKPSWGAQYGPVFTAEDLDETLLAEWREAGQEWYSWLTELGELFRSQPRYADLYPEYFEYYNIWIAWYNKYRR